MKGVQTNILSGLRSKGALIAGGIGAAQLSQGNVGGAAQSFGLAGLLMAPEIIEFLTGSVVNVLALKGLIGGGRGVAASGVGKNIAGASKLKNPLLITAALAASLLIPSLAQAGQSGDQRRKELATKVIRGDQTINKPDVTRFRNQLNRFDRILSSITFDKKKTKDGDIDAEALEDEKKQLELKNKENKENKDNQEEVEPKGMMRGLTGLLDFATFNLFDFDKRGKGNNTEKEKEKNVSLIEGDTNIDLASRDGDTNIEGDNFQIDDSTKISLVQNLSENTIFNDQVSNIFESNEELATDLLPNLDIAQMGREIKTEVSNNVIDLSSKQDNKVPSAFVGQSASPGSVFVNTAFRTGGGIIDKFEAASSLRSYGAFS